MNDIEIANYVTYMNFITEKLERFFNKQKPYICCKEGCSLCCKGAQFPYSNVEMQYLLKGALLLEEEIQNIITNRVQEILKKKAESKEKKFRYDCPFLINDKCSVYNYRGLVCRSFGLLTNGADGKVKAPFCGLDYDLNYSNVLDKTTHKISTDMFKKLNTDVEPVAFNVSYEFLTDADFERGFNFKFGEIKPLIDWFEKPNE